MIQLFLFLSIFSLLPIFMMFLNLIISKKINQNREKKSPFECGFDPISNNHPPFSIHFFLISLIFLIFDIEITMLIPLVPLESHFNPYLIMTFMFFLLILILGLYTEYTEQSIDWKI